MIYQWFEVEKSAARLGRAERRVQLEDDIIQTRMLLCSCQTNEIWLCT